MTNEDKVKSMTTKELAEIIMCPYDGIDMICKVNEQGLRCNECCEDWLKCEVETCVD